VWIWEIVLVFKDWDVVVLYPFVVVSVLEVTRGCYRRW
jgi:hypothetical protein